jgi:hypothetical protein
MAGSGSPDGAKRHPGPRVPHFAWLNAGYLLVVSTGIFSMTCIAANK